MSAISFTLPRFVFGVELLGVVHVRANCHSWRLKWNDVNKLDLDLTSTHCYSGTLQNITRMTLVGMLNTS